jgi:MFS family permease
VRYVDAHLRRLYLVTLLFGMACGISVALTSVHLDAHHYTKGDIGTLAAFFASGIVIFSVPAGMLVRRFSAKRTLAVSLLGYAVTVAAFPFLPSYAAIAAVRFVDGACSVGVWVSSETIVLSRADRAHKAYLTTLYAIALASGYVLGSLVAAAVVRLLPVSAAFVVAGLLAVASGALTAALMPPDAPLPAETEAKEPAEERSALPDPPETSAAPSPEGARPSTATILWRIKTSCFGTYAYGYFQASVVLFLNLYLIESKGVPLEDTAILPALFSLGMLLCSNIAGRIADRVGHLLIMRTLSLLGTMCILGFVFIDRYWLMCLVVFGAGGTLAAMSPVSLALQGVVTDPRDYSRANTLYNVFYASGMLIGPPASSYIFQRYGGESMLYHLAALWAAYVLFTVVFMRDDPAARRGRAGGGGGGGGGGGEPRRGAASRGHIGGEDAVTREQAPGDRVA